MSNQERLAFDRVKQSGVKSDDTTIISFIRHVSPETVLQSSLRDIREVANAF